MSRVPVEGLLMAQELFWYWIMRACMLRAPTPALMWPAPCKPPYGTVETRQRPNAQVFNGKTRTPASMPSTSYVGCMGESSIPFTRI